MNDDDSHYHFNSGFHAGDNKVLCLVCSEKSDKGEHPPPEPRQESSSCEDHMGQVGKGDDGDGGGDYQANTFEHDVVERLKIAWQLYAKKIMGNSTFTKAKETAGMM